MNIITAFRSQVRENASDKVVSTLQLGLDKETKYDYLPVVSRGLKRRVESLIKSCKPKVVILTGQAPGRTRISLERFALNILDFTELDESGVSILGKTIEAEGPHAYKSSIKNLGVLQKKLVAKGFPVEVSNHAGTYLCNQIYYHALHYSAKHKLKCKILFVHLPLFDKVDQQLSALCLSELVKILEQ